MYDPRLNQQIDSILQLDLDTAGVLSALRALEYIQHSIGGVSPVGCVLSIKPRRMQIGFCMSWLAHRDEYYEII